MYQDPKGDRIDGTTTTKNKTNDTVDNITDDNFYKSRIVSLNEEIITLNRRVKTLDGELAMVGIHCLFTAVVKVFVLCSSKVCKVETKQ